MAWILFMVTFVFYALTMEWVRRHAFGDRRAK